MYLRISYDKYEEIPFPIDFPKQQCPSGMPQEVLKLKVGACIMLPSNLDHS